MLNYGLDQLQWWLLTSSGPVAALAFLISAGLFIWLAATYWKVGDGSNLMKIGLPAIALLAIAMFLPSMAPIHQNADKIAKELSTQASLDDVKLFHVETRPATPISEGAVVYLGTAMDKDKDVRQFRFTQYEHYGVYEMIGFDKPVSAELDDLKGIEKGLKDYGLNSEDNNG